MFYTYMYLRTDYTPYYVGKGTGRRAFQKDHRTRPPVDESRILIQEFPTEEDAFVAEMFLIRYYGRKDLGTGCLRNLTDGGEGRSGSVLSADRLAIQVKNINSPEAKKKQTAALRKYNENPAAREKNAETQRKLWDDLEYREWMTEKRREQGRKKKLSHCKRGHELSPNNRDPRSDECLQCKKMHNDIHNAKRRTSRAI